jgi:hypothetical protein
MDSRLRGSDEDISGSVNPTETDSIG